MRMKIVLAVLAVTAILHRDFFAAAECPPGVNPFSESGCGWEAKTEKCSGPEYDCDWPESDCDGEHSFTYHDVRQCSSGAGAACKTCYWIGACWSSQKCYTPYACAWDPQVSACVSSDNAGADGYVGDATFGTHRLANGAPCCTSADTSKIKTGVLAQTSSR